MSNGILGLYFFEAGQVEGVGFTLQSQDKVVEFPGKLSTDNISKNFPL